MRGSSIRIGAGAAFILPALVSIAAAGEIKLEEIPEAIRATLAARFKDAETISAATEKDAEGKEIYEVSLTGADQNNIDVTITPEGALIIIEQQIGRKELPEGIAKTLEAKYPKARYRIVEKVLTYVEKEEKLTGYEVILFTPKKEMWAVEFAVDGKIVKEEKQDPNAED